MNTFQGTPGAPAASQIAPSAPAPQPMFYNPANVTSSYGLSQQPGAPPMASNYTPPPFLSGVPMVPQYRDSQSTPESQFSGASVIQSFVGAATSLSNSKIFY